MAEDLNYLIKGRMDRIRFLVGDNQGSLQYFEAGGLALTVLHDTVGGSHPLSAVLDNALKSKDWTGALAASRAVVALYEQGGFKSTPTGNRTRDRGKPSRYRTGTSTSR